MEDDELLDVIEGYDAWRTEQMREGPDVSASAYLAARRAARAFDAIGEAATSAARAIEIISNVLDEETGLTHMARADLSGAVALLKGPAGALA